MLSQRNLIVVEESREEFVPEAAQTPVRMPGDTTTTTVPLAPGEIATTTTIPLVEPDAANFLVTVTLVAVGHVTAQGAVYTSTKNGSVVNANLYKSSRDVYLSGGPQANGNCTGGLPLGFDTKWLL